MAERRRRSRRHAEKPPMARATAGSERAADRLRRWKARAELARKARRRWEDAWQVRTLEEFYLGDQVRGEDREVAIWINEFFSTVETMKPNILLHTPTFGIRAMPGRREPDRVQARLMEALLKAIAEQDQNLATDAALAFQQAFFRMGVLKVSYDPRMVPNPRAGEPMLQQVGEGLELPIFEESGEPVLEPKEILSDEVYSWDWVDASRMLLPDEGPNPRRWTWIGEEVEVSLDEAKADTRFSRWKNQLRPNAMVQADKAQSQPVSDFTPGDPEQDERARVRYTEAWDILEKKLYIWADGQDFDDFLVEDDVPPGVEDHPYALLRLIPIVGPPELVSPWPLPFVYNWWPLQREYNTLRTVQLSAAKRAARKVLYEASTFPDEEEARKMLASPNDMEAVQITDLGRLPVLFADSSLSADVTRQVAQLAAEWRIVTGQTGARLAAADSDTATEASFVERAAGLRDSAQQTLVELWLAVAGRKMLQLVRQTLTLDLYLSIKDFSEKEFTDFVQSERFQALLQLQYGEGGAALFLQALQLSPLLQQRLRERFGHLRPLRVTREQLQAEADVVVLPGSMKPRSLPMERGQLMQLVKILGPAALASPTLIDELLRSFDLLAGDRITEEITTNMQRLLQAQQAGQPAGGGSQTPTPPGIGRQLVSPQATAAGVMGG
jgi:hypothetical protein